MTPRILIVLYRCIGTNQEHGSKNEAFDVDTASWQCTRRFVTVAWRDIYSLSILALVESVTYAFPNPRTRSNPTMQNCYNPSTPMTPILGNGPSVTAQYSLGCATPTSWPYETSW